MNRLPLISLVLTIMLLLLPTAQAADIETSGTCTLADAITAANNDRAKGGCPAGRGADTIILTQDITLGSELPAITSKITIEGNGYTISGNNRYRMFYNDGGALTIKDLTMTKGYVEAELIRSEDGTLKASTENSIGGAIYNANGTLTISDSSFSHNSTENDGGAVYNGEYGELSISSSSFSHNLADAYGGAILNAGELSISSSSLSRNSAYRGGAIFNDGELSISGSVFSGNSAEVGGAIDDYFGELISISGSVFSGNSADFGGAIDNIDELSIVNSTFSHNSADKEGSAIRNIDELSIGSNTFIGNAIFNGEDGKLSMVNSIIAGGSRNACSSNGELTQNINNFIQDGTCSPAFSGDPMLGELVEPEDGSPAYYPLLEGSPAIDAADDEYCPDTGMLGTARPQGAACDIGAYERPQ